MVLLGIVPFIFLPGLCICALFALYILECYKVILLGFIIEHILRGEKSAAHRAAVQKKKDEEEMKRTLIRARKTESERIAKAIRQRRTRINGTKKTACQNPGVRRVEHPYVLKPRVQ